MDINVNFDQTGGDVLHRDKYLLCLKNRARSEIGVKSNQTPVCLSLTLAPMPPRFQKTERLHYSIMVTEIKNRIRCYVPGL